MKVVVVYNLDMISEIGEVADLVAIQDTSHTALAILVALQKCGYETDLVAVSTSLDELETRLSSFSPKDTFIFHNCDGFLGRSLGAADLVERIEQLGFAHTAANAAAIRVSTDKRKAKSALVQAGVSTPAYQICEKADDFIHVPCPVIVKPVAEEASLGITLKSVARTPDAIPGLIAHILSTYDQPALVEQFITGRELACAILGNGAEAVVFPVSEMDYSQIPDPLARLLTYESKWVEGTFYHDQIGVHCPAELEPAELQVVQQTALGAYKALQMRDFCRLDIRLDKGHPVCFGC